MTLQGPATRVSHLRQTYIEISRYFRSHLLYESSRSRTAPTRSFICRRRSSTLSIGDVEKPSGGTPAWPPTHARDLEASRKTTFSKEQYACLKRFEQSGLQHPELSLTPSIAWEKLLKPGLGADSAKERADNHRVAVLGYITSQRSTKQCEFFQLVDPRLELAIQVVLPNSSSKAPRIDASRADSKPPSDASGESERDDPSSQKLQITKILQPHTPVQVIGSVVSRRAPPKQAQPLRQAAESQDRPARQEKDVHNTTEKLDPFVGVVDLISHVEIRADYITPLNTFPPNTIAAWDTVFPPEMRHLQFRTDHELRNRIRLRSRVASSIRQRMLSRGFDEIETPLLFKSTPEGAREFIVPTRKKGYGYALPQSPQQYKQVLMASGISRYFQFARCFRDEDLRADRQPEFTQLDLEMSFAGATQVMRTVEDVILNAVWPSVPNMSALRKANSDDHATISDDDTGSNDLALPQLSYHEVMSRYGSDKPDTRLGSEIHRIDDWLPPNVKGMHTSLEEPVVEMIKIGMQGCSPSESGQFIRSFLDAPSAYTYVNNPDGMPGVSVYDTSRPLNGLASFGHEAASRVEEHFEPEPGDIFIVQTRVNAPFSGGSTMLGNLRREIYQSAISQGLIPGPAGFSALWVTDFPLFSPTVQSEPGQGGLAGICSTHHPFTAPKPGQDLSLLFSDPLSIIGDHYDLVINGVEVGGGSRRIHSAEMQELIFRDVLKMKPERLEDFRHLINALRSGCPPHAGFALGFDRLMALLTGRTSVRDVIAFPKHTDGQDRFVGSPSELTEDQLATYHLAVVDKAVEDARPQLSLKA